MLHYAYHLPTITVRYPSPLSSCGRVGMSLGKPAGVPGNIAKIKPTFAAYRPVNILARCKCMCTFRTVVIRWWDVQWGCMWVERNGFSI